jgi:hypothetical protein
MKDLYSNVKAVAVLDPIACANGDAPYKVIDLAGFNSALIGFHVGLTGSPLGSSNYWTMKLEHADDDGTGSAGSYASVAAADVLGVTPESGIIFTVNADTLDNALYACGYVGGKRFIKITIAETGTGPTIPLSAFVIKGHPQDAPPIS